MSLMEMPNGDNESARGKTSMVASIDIKGCGLCRARVLAGLLEIVTSISLSMKGRGTDGQWS